MTWTACLDFETDGIDPNTARPCSVAVVRAERGKAPVTVLSMLINPGRPIPARATEIHGIADADVADAVPWPAAAQLVVDAIDGCGAIACHNAPYDVRILTLAITVPRVPVFCTLAWARAAWWGRGDRTANFRLSTIAERLGVDLNAHNAESDATAVAHMLAPLRALCVERAGMPRSDAWAVGEWTAARGREHEATLAEWFRRERENRWDAIHEIHEIHDDAYGRFDDHGDK